MLKIREYVKVKNLEEAYELNQKKSNRIIGGMLWLKMSKLNVGTAIDLSDLGLDKIVETEEAFEIGCMATLRDFENHAGLLSYTGGASAECVKDIVGVQFRNLATMGGSIYSRFGFSDPLTLLLSLDTYVNLYKGGCISLNEYVNMKKDRDILTGITVKKQAGLKCAYYAYRNSRTDFPVINCAVSVCGNKGVAVIGARPHKAVRCEFDASDTAGFAEEICKNITFGSNMRASKEYREHLAKVLLERALHKCGKEI